MQMIANAAKMPMMAPTVYGSLGIIVVTVVGVVAMLPCVPCREHKGEHQNAKREDAGAQCDYAADAHSRAAVALT